MTRIFRFFVFFAVLLAFNPISHGAGTLGTAMGGPGGCASMGAAGNSRCTPFPQGLQGTIRAYVLVVYSAETSGKIDESDRQTAISYYSNYVKDGLNRLAAANPSGPQFQFLEFNEARKSDLWVQVIVEGETARIYDEEGYWTHVKNTWCQVYATGLGYEHLFNFNSPVYDNPSPDSYNIYAFNGMYDSVAEKAYGFFAYGWSCN